MLLHLPGNLSTTFASEVGYSFSKTLTAVRISLVNSFDVDWFEGTFSRRDRKVILQSSNSAPLLISSPAVVVASSCRLLIVVVRGIEPTNPKPPGINASVTAPLLLQNEAIKATPANRKSFMAMVLLQADGGDGKNKKKMMMNVGAVVKKWLWRGWRILDLWKIFLIPL